MQQTLVVQPFSQPTVGALVHHDYFFFFYMMCIDYGLCSADPKNSHMRELEGAKERLTLCRADLLDCQSLREAIYGCDGVFHTACPVTDDPVSTHVHSP